LRKEIPADIIYEDDKVQCILVWYTSCISR
jgi:hypothetical protein